MRMMLDSHINCLFIPLIENYYTIDVYMYTDNYNTSRSNKNSFIWSITNLNTKLFNYFENRIKNYANNLKIVINDDYKYNENDYNSNIFSQLNKFYNVLKLAKDNDTYDLVIRLRPDIYFESKLCLDILKENIVYQNRENLHNNYNGDSIQIFNGKYLNNILNKTYKILCSNGDAGVYEYLLNDIFKSIKLDLEWLDYFASRWYDKQAKYFTDIKLQYIDDWINIEYPFTFSVDKIKEYLTIRNDNKNILIYDNKIKMDKKDQTRLLYLAALNPDMYMNCNVQDIIYKDVIGLIPCSGTASRMNGLPKFLLPCKEGNLIDNSINIFKMNNIDDIYVSISTLNEHYMKNKNNIKYIVRDTITMSETVKHLIDIKSKKYILIMPDTYFINDSNTIFNEITKMNIMLNKFDIVVIIWKIKEYQYGKLGQIQIGDNKVLDIMDKNKDCLYPYSWGVIGWTNKVNYLIDETTPHIGYIINSALKQNIDVGYIISDTEYFDCGTPDEYFKMIKKCTD